MSDGQSNEGSMNAAEVLLERGLAEASGGHAALVGDGGSVTYADLDRLASQAAYVIDGFGAGPGDRVLILADDRPEFFYAYLGAMKAGAVPVALNLRLSAENLAYIMADSGCALVLADAGFTDLCRRAMADLDAPPPLATLDEPVAGLPFLGGEMEGCPDRFQAARLGPDDAALWMYTSGTTGEPKAVVHRQRSMNTVDRYLTPVFGAGPGDRIYCSSKMFFAFSLGHTLLAGLRSGATVVVQPGWPTAEAVAGAVERHRPHLLFSVPTLYRALLQEGLAGAEGFAAVRHFISAGEHLPDSLARQWQAATGAPILQGIGATETLMMFMGNRPLDNRIGATGKPFPGTRVKLVDDGGEAIEEPGIPGVLWVKSDSLAREYWRREDKTDAAFRDGWYVTGDMFCLDGDGFYHYQGRDDDMLKISGQWVSPAEIEEHVLANPKVSQAAVIGVEDASGLVRLALCLVTAGGTSGHEALERELTETLTGALSIYKCPRRFIFLDEMPLTATGKVQRFKLRQLAVDYMDANSYGTD